MRNKIFSNLIFVFFLSSVVFTQTDKELKQIASSYDKGKIAQTQSFIEDQNQKRKVRINNFLNSLSDIERQSVNLNKLRDVTVDGVPLYYESHNAGSSATIRANTLYTGGSLGLDVNGETMRAAIWEAENGYPLLTHADMMGRVIIIDAGFNTNFHATHVAGTIISSGANSPTNDRGIAYQGSIFAANSQNDYQEMNPIASSGVLLSNHSYGYGTSGLPIYFFGKYNLEDSYQMDLITSSNPFFLPVISAGNDRNNNPAVNPTKGGFDLLTGMSNSKNGITSAAVNQLLNYTAPNDVVMSDFSNFGPTDDGRIKPDISSQGVGVNSTSSSSNTGYAVTSGTSMSAPAITGLLLLLQQHYNDINSQFMLAATAKGLLLHTADEAGFFPGPDYRFGWGLANGERAANTITNNEVSTLISEEILEDGKPTTFEITATGSEPLMVSISWTDPPPSTSFFTTTYNTAIDDSTPVIINDLDITLSKDGTDYYPWKLNPASPFSAATRNSSNDVDNFEKIEVDTPTSTGTYTLTVDHKGSLLNGNDQNYSLIITGGTLTSLSNEEFSALDRSLYVYPNPAKDNVTLANTSNIKLDKIEVYDSLGRLALKQNLDSVAGDNKIDISRLYSGLYFLNVYTDFGTITRKIIKSN